MRNNMETMKQYGGRRRGKEMSARADTGRRWVAKAITGEITTERVIARLNGTITGLIWPLIVPATALRNDAPLFCARADGEDSSRSTGAGISRQIAFRDIERILFDWTSCSRARERDSICRTYAARIYLRCLLARLYVRGRLRLDLITRSSTCCTRSCRQYVHKLNTQRPTRRSLIMSRVGREKTVLPLAFVRFCLDNWTLLEEKDNKK